jgi:hypothetical protein
LAAAIRPALATTSSAAEDPLPSDPREALGLIE